LVCVTDLFSEEDASTDRWTFPFSMHTESQVVGPHQPVVALVDDDVILPCHVEPAEDVTAQILEWTRSDLNPRFVHVWRSGQDLVNTRNPSYRGRSSLFINELKRGNISLKLSRINYAPTIQDFDGIVSEEQMVRCSYLVTVKNYVYVYEKRFQPGKLVLQCESAGWYPEPELLWLDGEGNLLSAGPTETLRGPDDLYTVSSRVTVEKRHSNNITCRVQQRNTNQSRETHIHVPEDFFDIPSSSPSVTIGLAVSLALCIMMLILSAVLAHRKKQNTTSESLINYSLPLQIISVFTERFNILSQVLASPSHLILTSKKMLKFPLKMVRESNSI
uniref:Ig-like domain-containing protein n=1 Tax=Pundamilia nyererei TaxID=303518 RepID=A0A3B4GJW6_9CICH